MPHPLAYTRQALARHPAVVNPNPALSGNGERVDGVFYHIFDIDQTFNGEDFTAGSLLIGDNSVDTANILFDGSAFRFRIGTIDSMTWTGGGVEIEQSISYSSPYAISVGLGNVDINPQSNTLVRIISSTGDFTIQEIADAGTDGRELILINDTVNNMTLQNNSGVGTADYSDVFTMTGADITKTGFSIARLIWVENISSPGTFQWLLMSFQG